MTLVGADHIARAVSRWISILDAREVAHRRTRPRVVREAGRHPSLLRERQGGRRLSHRQRFPDGAIIVDEAVSTKDGDGRTKGLVFEGDRRFLDVMVKNSSRYGSTGGWGYEHFDRDDTTGRLFRQRSGEPGADWAAAGWSPRSPPTGSGRRSSAGPGSTGCPPPARCG